ncbi:unnamed protein product [marine sediment metagenome]|uniref:HTH merR-type domain-containing protein n=1 Tax=marine sediment metagenome TaxID=412755 RepID=X1N7T8_9ZZZZ
MCGRKTQFTPFSVPEAEHVITECIPASAFIPELRPRKNRAGNRAYTERDIKIVKLIKNLLYEEKFTIVGAKNKLKSDKQFVDSQLSLELKEKDAKTEGLSAELLKLIDMVDAL